MKRFIKKTFLFLFDWAKLIALTLIIVIPIRLYVFQPFIVKGQSMEPSFAGGDYLIIDQLTYRFRDPLRLEVIVFKFPANPRQFYIKRLIGIPNETIEIKNGKLRVFDKDLKEVKLDLESYDIHDFANENIKLKLGEDEYFVLGDNLSQSYDSRRWGPLSKHLIIGRVILRIWPFNKVEAYFK